MNSPNRPGFIRSYGSHKSYMSYQYYLFITG
jgi:hypothetical protein